METALGLLGIAAWIVAVTALAAAVTWVVVRVSPGEKPGETDSTAKSRG